MPSTDKHRCVYLGCSDDLRKAAQMYDNGARRYYGKHAVLNFPNED